jgi:hypothetical protein
MVRGLAAIGAALVSCVGAVALLFACVGDDPNPGNTTIIVNGEGGTSSSTSSSSSSSGGDGSTNTPDAAVDAGPPFCRTVGKPVLCDDFDQTSSNPPTGWGLEVGNTGGGMSGLDDKHPKSLPNTFFATNGPSNGTVGYRQEITRTFSLMGPKTVTLNYEIALEPTTTPSVVGVSLFWPATGSQIALSADTTTVALGYATGPGTFTTLARRPINWAVVKPVHVTIVIAGSVVPATVTFSVNNVLLDQAPLPEFKLSDSLQVNAGISDNRTLSVAKLWLDNVVLHVE